MTEAAGVTALIDAGANAASTHAAASARDNREENEHGEEPPQPNDVLCGKYFYSVCFLYFLRL